MCGYRTYVLWREKAELCIFEWCRICVFHFPVARTTGPHLWLIRSLRTLQFLCLGWWINLAWQSSSWHGFQIRSCFLCFRSHFQMNALAGSSTPWIRGIPYLSLQWREKWQELRNTLPFLQTRNISSNCSTALSCCGDGSCFQDGCAF